MEKQERQRLYKEAVARLPEVTRAARLSDAFGVSNSAKVIGGGLFAFNANLNGLGPDVDQIVVHCLLRFPPEDEVYFSLVVKDDLATLRARLDEMKAAGTSQPRGARAEEREEGEEEETPAAAAAASPDGLTYTDNSKNVKGYIARDGRLYLRNKGYWDTMPPDLTTISRPVTIDRIVFGIWPPAATARRSLLARDFVGYLGSLIGREKVHEVDVWPDATALSASMRRLPDTLALADIETAMKGLGGWYPNREVARYHGALSFLPHKHFVILSGLSGTGKTNLALQYARAVHGIGSMSAADPLLFVCPVRPEWTDPAGLTGYYDVLSNRYVVPPFLEAALVATAQRNSPVFVILDEMNLARVEYYFADVLSCIESGEPLQLHSSGVPLEGSTGVPVPASLPVPSNLFITGTINVDETTSTVSDKVLDRAFVIEMSKVDLVGYLTDLRTRQPDLADAVNASEPVLTAVHSLLAKHGLGFGYRVASEFVRYQAFAAKHLGMTAAEVADELMVQKVLVKLRGTMKLRPLLTQLQGSLPGQQSQALLARLLADLDEFGSFQTSR